MTDEPQKVIIQEPVPASMISGSNPASAEVRESRQPVPSPEPSLAPRTTLEQDKKTAGQRGINLIWETTQSRISQVVVGTTCVGVLVSLAMRGLYPERIVAFPSEWWAIVGLVIGFYFGRTNHARAGDPPSITGT